LTHPSTSRDEDDDEDDFYAPGHVYGRNITDVFSLGGATIPDFTMGLVNYSIYSTARTDTGFKGVLGLGYKDSTDGSDSLPLRFLEQGLINTTAYSIWMEDEAGSAGSVLLGAIDTTKYTGNLTRLTSSSDSEYDMMARVVSINGITGNGEEYTIKPSSTDDQDFLFTAVYNPTDAVSILPTLIASGIWDLAGAYYDANISQALISCSAAWDGQAGFTIQLGSPDADAPILSVSMADLVIPRREYDIPHVYGSAYRGKGGVCLFGVQNKGVRRKPGLAFSVYRWRRSVLSE